MDRPTRMTLGEIAFADPKLAYTLMNAGKISLGGYVDTGGWEIVNVGATFGVKNFDYTSPPEATIPPGTIIKGQLFGTVEADIWVRKVTYTVRRPLAYGGNIFKSQSDYYNAQNPNIDFQLTINSYSRYVISSDFMPLENISMAFDAAAPAGVVLRFSSNIQTQLINRRPLYGVPPLPTNCTPICAKADFADQGVTGWPFQPVVGGTMTLVINTTTPPSVGQEIFIANVGTYTVVAISGASPTYTLTLQLVALPASGTPAPGSKIADTETEELCVFWLICPPLTTPTVGENPTEVVISFHGTRLPSEVYGSCEMDKAVDFLRKKGVLPEKP